MPPHTGLTCRHVTTVFFVSHLLPSMESPVVSHVSASLFHGSCAADTGLILLYFPAQIFYMQKFAGILLSSLFFLELIRRSEDES
jgi:hypothetical protein